jgi:hypothetical protein
MAACDASQNERTKERRHTLLHLHIEKYKTKIGVPCSKKFALSETLPDDFKGTVFKRN